MAYQLRCKQAIGKAFRAILENQGGNCWYCNTPILHEHEIISRQGCAKPRDYHKSCALKLHIILDEGNSRESNTKASPSSNGKLPLPSFITDDFAIKLLQAVGGRATLQTMQQYLIETYDFDMKTAQYATQKFNDLKSSCYVIVDRDKKTNKFYYSFRPEVKPLLEPLVSASK